jgi:hypothetical protein
LWLVCAVLLVVALRAEWSMVRDSAHSFTRLHWGALIGAVAAEVGSMTALALMERRILVMAGVRVPPRRAIAIAYASNAMSQSLPVIGSGAATAYSYQRLVAQGAAPALAGWALSLAGVVSSAAFVVVISIGAVVSGSIAAVAAGGAGMFASVLVLVIAVLAIRRATVRQRVNVTAVWALRLCKRTVRRPAGDPAAIVADTMTGLTQFRMNRRDVTRVVYGAFRNWAFDLLCLALSIRAAGVHVPWWGIILAWAAGSGSSSLNLTPGGLGVVEAALTASLVALGIPAGPALTAVLIYRGITFWLAIAIGWPLFWWLRRQPPLAAAPGPTAASAVTPATATPSPDAVAADGTALGGATSAEA